MPQHKFFIFSFIYFYFYFHSIAAILLWQLQLFVNFVTSLPKKSLHLLCGNHFIIIPLELLAKDPSIAGQTLQLNISFYSSQLNNQIN